MEKCITPPKLIIEVCLDIKGSTIKQVGEEDSQMKFILFLFISGGFPGTIDNVTGGVAKHLLLVSPFGLAPIIYDVTAMRADVILKAIK